MPPENYTNLSDEALAKLVLEDPHALVTLIRRYESRLLLYIRRISGFSHEDAEDILQESFLDAYKHIADFDASLKFSSWIYRIAHNRTISEYRKRKKSLGDVSIDNDDEGMYRLLAANLDSSTQTEQNLTQNVVNKILAALPDRDRTVLVLAYIEEKTYDEIGDILKAPAGTIATWIHRAKKKFQQEASKYEIASQTI